MHYVTAIGPSKPYGVKLDLSALGRQMSATRFFVVVAPVCATSGLRALARAIWAVTGQLFGWLRDGRA